MDDGLKTAPRSRAMMQRLREHLVEESQRLDEDVARLAQEAGRLVEDAKRLDGDAGRLGGQTAAMNDRLTALRRLVNDLLNTATLAESVTEVRAMEHDGG